MQLYLPMVKREAVKPTQWKESNPTRGLSLELFLHYSAKSKQIPHLINSPFTAHFYKFTMNEFSICSFKEGLQEDLKVEDSNLGGTQGISSPLRISIYMSANHLKMCFNSSIWVLKIVSQPVTN